MKNILVPCDFSEWAISAFRQALDVATKSDGVVHLLHVIEPPLINDSTLMLTLNVEEELMNEKKLEAERLFKDMVKTSKLEHVNSTFDVKVGAVSETIQDYIVEHNIDMVIMGSKGASGLKEVFIGSNAEKVVRSSSVPVLIIKNYYGESIKKIVFPNTLDIAHQEDLINKVKELQDFFQAKLCIVYISIPSKFEDETTIRQHLSQFAKRYMFKDYTVNIYSHASPERGIVEFTKMVHGDMIALGTHGHKGIVHLLKGSVAEDIVNHSKRPIWTYHIKENKLVETQN
jgi:nucleotide-binding universal stress UspA family protein